MESLDAHPVLTIDARPMQSVGYRHQVPGYDVRSGEGARRFGGRFNPPGSFPVLYLCTTRECASAELARTAERQRVPLAALLPRELWLVDVEMDRVLDLTDLPTLRRLEIEHRDLIRGDYRLTRQIGEAAYEQRFQAVLTSSATGVDNVIAIFPENLGMSVLRVRLVEVWNALGDLP